MTSESLFRTRLFEISCVLFVMILWHDRTDGFCPSVCVCSSLFKFLNITCANQQINVIPTDIPLAVHTLDLSNNIIEVVSFRDYYLGKLHVLDLSKNNITEIYDLSTLKKLQILYLNHNKIANVHAIFQLPNLRILNLSKNPIESLDKINNRALTHLEADECAIAFLNATSLSNLPLLTTLSLKRNPLKSVQSPVSISLKKLDLSHCELKLLMENTLENMPNLQDLILRNNSLLGKSQSTFIKHDKLQTLDTSQCNWEVFTLNGLPELKIAKLSENRIRSLTSNIFSTNSNLHSLILSSNVIHYIDKHTFINLENLRILDLSSNLISDINKNAFINNVQLKILNLSTNVLEDVANLNTCNITTLDLSNNFLEEFPRLTNAENLLIINLKNNKISTINRHVLDNLPRLLELDLSENEFKQPFQASVFDNNMHLTSLDLSRNPWDCNCRKLRSLYIYLSTRNNSNIDKMKCFEPSEKRGYLWQSACIFEWIEGRTVKSYVSKTVNFIVIALLILFVLSGSIMSIRHTIKMRRLDRRRRYDAERAEIRERLQRLQRRNQQLEEEAISHMSEPRINPLELVGPPSYEEAVDMARLTRSLDTLNGLGFADTPVSQALGSVDSLRSKRRARRQKKKSPSDDSLTKRATRREIRLKKDRELRDPAGAIEVERLGRQVAPEAVALAALRSSSEQIDSSSDAGRHRPPTPVAKKRRRLRLSTALATTTDDEASDETVGHDRSPIKSRHSQPQNVD